MLKKILFTVLSIMISTIIISVTAIFAFLKAGRDLVPKAISDSDYDKVVSMYVAGFFDSNDRVNYFLENFGSVYIYNSVEERQEGELVVTDLALEVMFFPSASIKPDLLEKITLVFENDELSFPYIVEVEEDGNNVIKKDYLKYYDSMGFIPRTITLDELGDNYQNHLVEVNFTYDSKVYSIHLQELAVFSQDFLNDFYDLITENKVKAKEIALLQEEYDKAQTEEEKAEILPKVDELKLEYNQNLEKIKEIAKTKNYKFSASLNLVFKEPSFIIRVSIAVVICLGASIFLGYLIFRKR